MRGMGLKIIYQMKVANILTVNGDYKISFYTIIYKGMEGTVYCYNDNPAFTDDRR